MTAAAQDPNAPGRLRNYFSFFYNRILLAIVIPASAALLSFSQQSVQEQRADLELRLAFEREQDAVVSQYVSDVTGLITGDEFNLDVLECGEMPADLEQSDNKFTRIVRGRTVLALSQIKIADTLSEDERLLSRVRSGIRRGQVLRFLLDTGLSYVLHPTDLISRDFNSADLWGICLRDMALLFSDFSGAGLLFADLRGADIFRARFDGADLSQASLEGVVDIEEAIFNESTLMPDGSYWSPGMDMQRYTNPDHPDFWQPDWARS